MAPVRHISDCGRRKSISELRAPSSACRRDFIYIIEEKQEVCGLIGFHLFRCSKLAYRNWLLASAKYQHRGIMTKCVRHLCRIAVEERGMNRIQIRCAEGNTPSNAIPQRLGFHLEGTERDGELMYTKKFVNLNVYSILKKEIKQWKD